MTTRDEKPTARDRTKPGRRMGAAKQKQEKLLAAFAKLGKISLAAEKAGVDRRAHYRWMAGDKGYAAAFRILSAMPKNGPGRGRTRKQAASKKTPGRRMGAATKRKQEKFLAAFAELGNVSLAAMAAGVDRRTHYKWTKGDEGYAAAFDVAGD